MHNDLIKTTFDPVTIWLITESFCQLRTHFQIANVITVRMNVLFIQKCEIVTEVIGKIYPIISIHVF